MRFVRIIASCRIAAFAALVSSAQAAGCLPPDEGNMPYRRAVSRVKYLPETEAWSETVARRGAPAQYVLKLDATLHLGARCYWTVEVRSGEELWQRFFVSPDGKALRVASPQGPLSLAAWRAERARHALAPPPARLR